MFDANAKKYAVLGHPVGHSLSPFLQNTFFEITGFNGVYTAFDVPPDEIGEILPFLKKYFSGFNCTIPLKEAIIPYLDGISPRAKWCGSVNTVKTEDGRMYGYSTDGIGMVGALAFEDIYLDNKKVLITGSGGVARVALFEALERKASVTVAARNTEAAEKLCGDAAREMPDCSANFCDISDITGNFDILLQCTPVGMHPNENAMPISEKVIENIDAAFDMIYNPRDTLLIKTFKKMGKKAVGGINMLVLQAVAAQEIWRDEKFDKKNIEKLIDMVKI